MNKKIIILTILFMIFLSYLGITIAEESYGNVVYANGQNFYFDELTGKWLTQDGAYELNYDSGEISSTNENQEEQESEESEDSTVNYNEENGWQTSGGDSITGLGGEQITPSESLTSGMYKVGEEPMYYDGNDFVEPEIIVKTYVPGENGEEGEWVTQGYVVSNDGGVTSAYNSQGNPLDGSPLGTGYTKYGNMDNGGFVTDEDGNVYFPGDGGELNTADGHYTLILDSNGKVIERKSYANFQYNIFAAGMGYLQLGSKLADLTGVGSWAIGEDILHSWVTTQEGFESTICGRWTDGTNWPANYVLGENGFPAVHIEGEKINYTWINDSYSEQQENVYAYKISFEVNPREELTDDDYIQFQLKIDNQVYDLNGDAEGGETVRIKTGSAPYSKKGQEMIIEVYGPVANATGAEDPGYNEICLVFDNEFKYPYSKIINNKLCNSFVDKSGGSLGYGNPFGMGHSSSGGSSSSGEEGEERP